MVFKRKDLKLWHGVVISGFFQIIYSLMFLPSIQTPLGWYNQDAVLGLLIVLFAGGYIRD